LEQCQQRFHCPQVYHDYDALLEDTEVQAVYIPLPNHLHHEWVIRAARRGKHILCEKPLALNTNECLEMIAECDRCKVKLMEAFMYRYSDRTQKVMEILNRGLIGELKYISSSFHSYLGREDDYRWEPAYGGGCLYDVGCYPVNFINMITSCSPVAMTAEGVQHRGVDLIFTGILKYENGIIANLNCSFNSFLRVYSEIVGDKGVLEIPDTFLGTAGIITVTTAAGKREFKVTASDRYRLEIEDFAAAILDDRQPLLSTRETISNMKIIDQLHAEFC